MTFRAILAAVVLAVGVTGAKADPTLYIYDGIGTIEIVDNAIGDTSSQPGLVTWIGSIGTWYLNVTIGQTKPLIGSPTSPRMDIASFNASSLGGGMLRITFSDDFFGPVNGPFTADIGGNTAGSVTYSAFAGANNILGQNTHVILPEVTLTGMPFSQSRTSAALDLPAPFSISQQLVIRHAAAGSSGLDFALTYVPEPSAAALLLVAAALAASRRFGVRS